MTPEVWLNLQRMYDLDVAAIECPTASRGCPTSGSIVLTSVLPPRRRVSRGEGLMMDLDPAALAAYCLACARWSEAREALRTYGLMVKDADGLPTQALGLLRCHSTKLLLKQQASP